MVRSKCPSRNLLGKSEKSAAPNDPNGNPLQCYVILHKWSNRISYAEPKGPIVARCTVVPTRTFWQNSYRISLTVGMTFLKLTDRLANKVCPWLIPSWVQQLLIFQEVLFSYIGSLLDSSCSRMRLMQRSGLALTAAIYSFATSAFTSVRAMTSQSNKQGALIFLHGLGDTPAGWSILQFQLPKLFPRLANIEYVFPPAPTIPISINGGGVQ